MFCLFVFLASFLFIHNDDCIEFDELPQPQEDPPITASSSQNTDLLPHTSPVIEGAHEMDSDGEEESSSQEASPSKPVWKEALSAPTLHSFSDTSYPGPTVPIPETPKENVQLYFTPELVTMIRDETNKCAREVIPPLRN